jgi:hypothetical protein
MYQPFAAAGEKLAAELPFRISMHGGWHALRLEMAITSLHRLQCIYIRRSSLTCARINRVIYRRFLNSTRAFSINLSYRKSEFVRAVDVAEAFLPPDASIADIITDMLSQTSPETLSLDTDLFLGRLSDDGRPSPAVIVEGNDTCNLPDLPTHFIGRDHEVLRLVTLLESPEFAGILLLGGPGQVSCDVNFRHSQLYSQEEPISSVSSLPIRLDVSSPPCS